MSAREWKPGDLVALDPRGNGPSFLAANLKEAANRHEVNGFLRTAADLRDLVDQIEDARPLVVIDPEDREQIERFIRALDVTTGHRSESIPPVRLDNFAAALREFANPTPPRPEEPTGLGAVVEDAIGRKWVRANAEGEWFSEDGRDVETDYANVVTVRVLSEGVTA